MAEQVKSPEPGQYWEHVKSKDRVYFIGRAPDGVMVWQCEGDTIEHGELDWSDWQHIPGCTGWEWEPEKEEEYPQYWTSRNSISYLYVVVESPTVWKAVTTAGNIEDWTHRTFSSENRTRLKEQEAIALLDKSHKRAEVAQATIERIKRFDPASVPVQEHAETWPKFYVCNLYSPGYYRCDSQYKVWHIAPEGTEKQQTPASTLSQKAIWTEVTEAQAKARINPVESPDDWVVQDRVPARPGIDRGWWSSDDPPADKSYCWAVLENIGNGLVHGYRNDIGLTLSVFCRRKDLPAVPEPAEEFPQYWTTICGPSSSIAYIKRIDEKTIVSVKKDGTEVPDNVLEWNPELRKRLTKEEASALLTPEAETFPQWYILKEDDRRSWVPDWIIKRTGEETSLRYARDEAGELYVTEEPWHGAPDVWERCSEEDALCYIGKENLPEVAPAKKRFPIDLWVTYRVHDERGDWPVRATPAGETCQNWKRIQFDSNGAFIEVE